MATRDVLRRGEEPRTEFLDMESAKRCEVLIAPRDEDASHYLTFARTCHHPTWVESLPGDSLDMLGDAAAGRTLKQVAEGLPFTLRLSGLSRSCSHQLVRARIGWTFSEACTGDQDWRHAAMLVPRPMMRNDAVLEAYIDHCLMAKMLYGYDIDGARPFVDDPRRASAARVRGEGENMAEYYAPGSPISARFYIPPSLSTFVHAHTNLAALSVWYAARCCTMTQAWEMVCLAEAVREEVLLFAPWAKAAFERPCEKGACWYVGALKTDLEHVAYYLPDEVHERALEPFAQKDPLLFERSRATIYNARPFEVNSGPQRFETRRYMGLRREK